MSIPRSMQLLLRSRTIRPLLSDTQLLQRPWPPTRAALFCRNHSIHSRTINQQRRPQKDVIYQHVVQIGDPSLRTASLPIDPKDIKTNTIQILISTLKNVLSKYNSFGLSACQIGLPVQVVVIRLDERGLKALSSDNTVSELIPERVLINPKIHVTNNSLVTQRESCCSINGFSALVPRYKSVRVKYLNEDGSEEIWDTQDWTARIVQHEMHHLEGKFFTDFMNRESFAYHYWKEVNARDGHFKMGYEGNKKGFLHNVKSFILDQREV